MKTYLRSIPLSRFLIIWSICALSAQSLLKAQGIFREVFVGTTTSGIISNNGVIFTWDPVSNVYTKKFDFTGATGNAPSGELTPLDGKVYGLASSGGANYVGAIYTWDPVSNIYTKNLDLDQKTGSAPLGSMTFKDGKFYGSTYLGGETANHFNTGNGVLFEWDPISYIYTKKVDLAVETGSRPLGKLKLKDGKFYGLTSDGGANVVGTIFEWDPVTNVYTKEVDLVWSTGSKPFGSLALKDGKFYGLTNLGGANAVGVIFEWDPVTNIYTKKVDLAIATGSRPEGSLTLKDGKFYGLTSSGGANNAGVIFEWDPVSNIYTKKVDLAVTTGSGPKGSLTLKEGKFYGVTYLGGANNAGVIFEWNPVTNLYTKKVDLAPETGSLPSGDLTIIPAPAAIAPGVPNSCETYPAVTIDESNNNTWVPVTDQEGRAVAEIKANGNNLGEVNVSLYTHSGELRENTDHKLFLDRSLTITAQNNRLLPGTWVDLRLYILRDEYDVLAASVNSPEQTGLSSIQDLGVFKTHDNTCGAAISEPAVRIEATAGAWDGNYVFTLKTASFSSFHFAAKSPSDPLPVSLLSFTAEATPARAVQLEWATTQERNAAYFGVERSRDARRYEEIARIATQGKTHETTTYIHIDESPPRGRNYYRLRQVDQDGKFAYSRIVSIYGSETRFAGTPAPYPNPSKHGVIRIEARENMALRLTDLSGKEIPFTKRRIDAEITELTPGQSLQPGIYLVLKDGIGYKVIVE